MGQRSKDGAASLIDHGAVGGEGGLTHLFSVFNNSNPQCIGISHTNKSGTAAKGLLCFIQNTIPKEDYSSTAVNSKI